jgi:multimeric flavodoxin WrbA
MKILAISCSPRKNGNTVAMLGKVLAGAKADGADVELYSVAGKNIQPCDGCWGCRGTGKCHIQDDMQELYDKIAEADGIVYGTPIYFYGMTAQMKAVIDRSMALNQPGRSRMNKVGGIVTVCGSLGLVDALKDFAFYMMTSRMLPAGHVSAYLMKPEDLEKMPKCLEATHNLGRMMAALVKMGFKYPAEFAGPQFAFGTHTK